MLCVCSEYLQTNWQLFLIPVSFSRKHCSGELLTLSCAGLAFRLCMTACFYIILKGYALCRRPLDTGGSCLPLCRKHEMNSKETRN